MVKPASSLSDELIGHFRNLELTRSRMEELLVGKSVVRRDIEQIYSGLFLDAMTHFENFVESLFIGLLVGRLSSPKAIGTSKVALKSDRVAREVVYGGVRSYVDWFPYEQTEQRAKAFFREGRPFTILSQPEKLHIRRMHTVRNAIAHRSVSSFKAFDRYVVAGLPLMPGERTPTGYLRSQYRRAPVVTRYQELVSQMGLIATKLCG